MTNYFAAQEYLNTVREQLADETAPYRYTDITIFRALNVAMGEISRIRPDIFIDLKYQTPIFKGPLNDGVPGLFKTNYMSNSVPVPSSLFMPICWYMSAYCQFTDTDDTQDVRAQSFNQKFVGSLLSLAA